MICGLVVGKIYKYEFRLYLQNLSGICKMGITFAYELGLKSFLYEKASTRKVTSDFNPKRTAPDDLGSRGRVGLSPESVLFSTYSVFDFGGGARAIMCTLVILSDWIWFLSSPHIHRVLGEIVGHLLGNFPYFKAKKKSARCAFRPRYKKLPKLDTSVCTFFLPNQTPEWLSSIWPYEICETDTESEPNSNTPVHLRE